MAAELKRYKRITYCKFCKAEGKKERAIWMTKYTPAFALRDWYKHYACEEHKHLIEDTDPNRTRAEILARAKSEKPKRDDYMTEADYQTWGRL
jgi:hypothetical protein